VRGIGDAVVCLFGFATLGRYLGLWAPGAPGTSSEGEQPTPAG
jgi:hypothetical protein